MSSGDDHYRESPGRGSYNSEQYNGSEYNRESSGYGKNRSGSYSNDQYSSPNNGSSYQGRNYRGGGYKPNYTRDEYSGPQAYRGGRDREHRGGHSSYQDRSSTSYQVRSSSYNRRDSSYNSSSEPQSSDSPSQYEPRRGRYEGSGYQGRTLNRSYDQRDNYSSSDVPMDIQPSHEDSMDPELSSRYSSNAVGDGNSNSYRSTPDRSRLYNNNNQYQDRSYPSSSTSTGVPAELYNASPKPRSDNYANLRASEPVMPSDKGYQGTNYGHQSSRSSIGFSESNQYSQSPYHQQHSQQQHSQQQSMASPYNGGGGQKSYQQYQSNENLSTSHTSSSSSIPLSFLQPGGYNQGSSASLGYSTSNMMAPTLQMSSSSLSSSVFHSKGISAAPTPEPAPSLNQYISSTFKDALSVGPRMNTEDQVAFKNAVDEVLSSLQVIASNANQITKLRNESLSHLRKRESHDLTFNKLYCDFQVADRKVRLIEGDSAETARVIHELEGDLGDSEWPEPDWTLPPFHPPLNSSHGVINYSDANNTPSSQ